MLLSLIATLVIGQGAAAVACPMTGEASPATGAMIDYNGVRYTMCCAGCNTGFKKDPAKALKNEALKDKLVGISLFDPVSGLRIEPKDAKGGFSDFNGVRYYFAKADSKKTFEGEPKKFTVVPQKEVLYCAIMGHEVENYATAGGYVDVEETRYYVCCAGCMDPMKKDGAKFAAKSKDKAKAPMALDAPKKQG